MRPLLSEWAAFLGAEAERDIVVTLEATLRLWETSGAKVIDSWGDFAVRGSDSGAPASSGGVAESGKGSSKSILGKKGEKRETDKGSVSSRNLRA